MLLACVYPEFSTWLIGKQKEKIICLSCTLMRKIKKTKQYEQIVREEEYYDK